MRKKIYRSANIVHKNKNLIATKNFTPPFKHIIQTYFPVAMKILILSKCWQNKHYEMCSLNGNGSSDSLILR